MNKIKRELLATALLIVGLAQVAQAAALNPDPFENYVEFTTSGYTGSTTLANFPVLVRLSNNSPSGFSYAACEADGSDIRFADAQGNLIAHEFDTWNTNGESLVWVCVPQMSSATDVFTMYFNLLPDYEVSDLPEVNPQLTWANYAAVVHCNDFTVDATTNALALTKYGGNTVVTNVSKIGSGVDMRDNNNARVSLANPYAKLTKAGVFTVSGWLRKDYNSNNNGSTVFMGGMTAWDKNGFLILLENGTELSFTANNSGHRKTAFTWTLGQWYHVAVSYDTAYGISYGNGAKVFESSTIPTVANGNAAWGFGNYAGTGTCNEWFNGGLDEWRVYNGVASADYVKAEYDAVANPSFLDASAVKVPTTDSTLNTPSAVSLGEDAVTLSCMLKSPGFGAESATVSFAYGLAADALGNYSTLLSAAERGDVASTNLIDLTPNTTYYFAFKSENTLDGTTPSVVTGSVTTLAIPGAATGGTVVRQGDYLVHTFSLADSGATFTVPTNGIIADVMLVAGGGGGGARRAGGGGAGGLLYQKGVSIPAGAYAVTVGAGGAASTSSSKRGSNGGNTSLGALLTAIGGGGGGSLDAEQYGGNGGSGGGHQNRNQVPSGNVAGQGNYGGLTPYNYNVTASGGGGAGGMGGHPDLINRRGGNGGPGREVAITGEAKMYAAGGGSGCYRNGTDANNRYYPGYGGSGIGGNGGDGYSSSSECNATAPLAGTGSGGGGGGDNNGTGYTTGSAGASGVAVIRYYAPLSGAVGAKPVVDLVSAVADVDRLGIKLGWNIRNAGTNGGKVKVEAVYGTSTNAISSVATVAENQVFEGEGWLDGLLPDRTYYVKLRVTNAQGQVGESPAFEIVKMPKLSEYATSHLGTGVGLWQAKLAGRFNLWDDILSSATLRRELGAMMVYRNGDPDQGTGDYAYTSPIDSVVSSWSPASTFAYKGYVWLEKGLHIWFVGPDDYGVLWIDGEEIDRTTGPSNQQFGMYDCPKTGWHALELRIGNSSGGAGWATDQVSSRGCYFQSPPREPPGNMTQNSTWGVAHNILKDSSDVSSDPSNAYKSQLRTGPAGRGFSTGAYAVSDGTLTASLQFAAGNAADKLVVAYGSYRGGDETNAWEGCIELAAPGADAATKSVSATVPASANYARFATVDTTGNLAWGNTLYLDADAVLAETVTASTAGDTITFSGTTDAPEGTVVTIFYGTGYTADPSALTDSVTATVGADGTFSATLLNRPLGTAYYWYASFPGGTVTPIERIATGAGPVLQGNNIDCTHGKRFVVGVSVADLGAAASLTLTPTIKVNADGMDWALGVTMASRTITAPGRYTFEYNADDLGIDFGDEIDVQIAYSATYNATTWSGNLDYDSFALMDTRTFTWTGEGADDEWSNPDNWSVGAGDVVGAPGYPIDGSQTVFPVGDWTVTLSGTNYCNKISMANGTAEAHGSLTFVSGEGMGVLAISRGRITTVGGLNGTLAPNGKLELGDYNSLTLDGVAIDMRWNVDHLAVPQYATWTLTNGAELYVGNELFIDRESSRFVMEKDSRLMCGSHLRFYPNNGEFVLDNSQVYIGINETWAIFGQDVRTTPPRFTFKGDHPVLSVARLDPNADNRTFKFGFEVPKGGYIEPPIQYRGAWTTFSGSKTSSRYALEILPTSPALEGTDTITTTLIDAYNGFGVTIDKFSTDTGSLAFADIYGKGSTTALQLTLTGTNAAAASLPVAQPIVTTYGEDTIYTFTNTDAIASFTLPADVTADILVAGGGGAGGWSGTSAWNAGDMVGGGGGAGGQVVTNRVSLTAGTYAIQVGPGGWHAPNGVYYGNAGLRGGASSAFGLVAHGGGGGGGADVRGSRGWNRLGGNGFIAGGGARSNAGGQAYTGGIAGPAAVSGYVGAGAGAGGAAVAGSATDGQGKGGEGIASAITGTEYVYGSGGGAGGGQNYRLGGAGGSWSGGTGGNVSYMFSGPGAEDGLDGFGGGGGGGAADFDLYTRSNAHGQRSGGKGGDGVVILRIKNAPVSTAPVFELKDGRTVSGSSISIPIDYISAGVGAAEDGTSFFFAYTDGTNRTATLTPAITALGEATLTASGLVLVPGRAYAATVTATNSLGNGASKSFSFTAPADREIADFAGLNQARLEGERNKTDPILTAPTLRRELGAVMAYESFGSVSPIDGFVNDFPVNTTYAYSGYMYLTAGETVWFATYMAGNIYFTIDGVTKIDTSNNNNWWSYEIIPAYTGWHPIEFRVGHAWSANGPQSQYFDIGFGYTKDPAVYVARNGNNTRSAGWLKLMDPGDGSVLRTTLPTDCGISIGSMFRASETPSRITASIVADTTGSDLEIFACYGAANGGEDTNGWDHVISLGTMAGASTALLGVTDVDDALFLRYVGMAAAKDGYGATTRTETVYLPEMTAEEASDPSANFVAVKSVTAFSANIEVNVTTPGAGFESCDVSVAFGFSPDALIYTNVLKTAAAAGAFEATVNGLLPQRTYCAKVLASNTAGVYTTDGVIHSITTASDSGAVEGAPADETGVPLAVGLVQGVIRTAWTNNFDVLSADSPSIITRGAVSTIFYQNVNWTGTSVSEGTNTTFRWADNTTFGYQGYAYFPAATYTFGGSMDDYGTLFIDGEQVLNFSSESNGNAWFVGTKTLTAGWHAIRIYTGNGIGGAGPYRRRSATDGSGLEFNTNGVAASVQLDYGAWTRFENIDGQAPWLCTAHPGRTIHAEEVSVSEDWELTLRATLGTNSASKVYLCYGSTWGGEDTNAWEHVVALNEGADVSIDTDELTGITVPGWGADTRYVRLATVTVGATCWSETLVNTDRNAPAFSTDITVSGLEQGDKVDLTATLSALGTSELTVTVEVSESADMASATTYPCTVTDGVATVEDVPVAPGVETFYRFSAVNADGLTDITGIDSFTTKAGAAFGDGVSATANMREVTFTGTLADLGAEGDAIEGATVTLLLALEGETLQAVEASTNLTSAGAFSIVYTVPAFGIYNFAFKAVNGCASQSWTTQSAMGSITIQDNAVYTWKDGVASGVWEDANNWDSTSSEGVGYPQNPASTASFASVGAGESVRVTFSTFKGMNLALPTEPTASVTVASTLGANFAPANIGSVCSSIACALTLEASGVTIPAGTVFGGAGSITIKSAPSVTIPANTVFGGTGTITIKDASSVTLGGLITLNGGGSLVFDNSDVYLPYAQHTIAAGSSLVARNGSTVTRDNRDENNNTFWVYDEGSAIVLEGSSTMWLGRMCMKDGAKLVVDDSVVTNTAGTHHFFCVTDRNLNVKGRVVDLKGVAPRLLSYHMAVWGSPDPNFPATFNFHLPYNVSTSGAIITAKDFGLFENSGSGTWVVNLCDPEDPATDRHGVEKDVQLVAATADGAIVKDNIVFGELPFLYRKSDFYWTYDHTDARSGTVTTGLWIHLVKPDPVSVLVVR